MRPPWIARIIAVGKDNNKRRVCFYEREKGERKERGRREEGRRRGKAGGERNDPSIVFQFLTTLTRTVERKNRKFRGVNDVQRDKEGERGRVITGCDVGTTRELSRPRYSRLS